VTTLCAKLYNFVSKCRFRIAGMTRFLQFPLDAMIQHTNGEIIYSAESRWPLTMVVGLHIYHCCGRFTLNREDWFHHLVFLPTLGIPGMVFDWGCFGNWLVFFICGLPGGIDYMILALQKMNKCMTFNQKRISSNLNMWIRIPGILFGIGVAYVILMQGRYNVPIVFLAIQMIFLPFNVLYYAKQSTINYCIHQVRSYVPTQDWNELKRLSL